MDNEFQIDLSAEEIFVLAGLLGYETVFGIGEQQTFDFNGDLKRRIKSTVKTLERKKLIRYDLDGTLFIKSKLKLCIECICEAQTIGLFSTNIKTGKNATMYVLEKNNMISLVEKMKNGKYRVLLGDDSFLSKIFPSAILNSKSGGIREKMLYEEAVCIQEQICSFNETQANTLLRKCISSEENIPCISEILSGGSKFLNVRIFRKDKRMYKTSFNSLIAISHNKSICVSADENEVVNFCAIEPKQVYEQVEVHLFGKNKGGVV